MLIIAAGVMVRFVMGGWGRRTSQGAAEKLAQLEERVVKIEEATSTIVAEFAAVRERERFLRQIVETKSRKSAETPAIPAVPTPVDPTSPFVVQTVSAARRT
ncbi:MAG TPA: emp24/gp25L/p24 family protein [Gemmatimonadaceae bacterium]|nr:emp24/gp25L/p24 family protein [Gemmatimonadaceae bacterium]